MKGWRLFGSSHVEDQARGSGVCGSLSCLSLKLQLCFKITYVTIYGSSKLQLVLQPPFFHVNGKKRKGSPLSDIVSLWCCQKSSSAYPSGPSSAQSALVPETKINIWARAQAQSYRFSFFLGKCSEIRVKSPSGASERGPGDIGVSPAAVQLALHHHWS